MKQTDVLVIGSGIAGLSFALKIASEFPDVSIDIITKSDESESNTKYAQGGIAVVTNLVTDSYQQHIEDTMQAGDYLNDRSIVEMVVREAPQRLNELVSWGARFDRATSGEFKLAKEGGHSSKRVIHHKDMTGFEMEISLLDRVRALKNIRLHSYHFAIDLIINNDKVCCGAEVLNLKSGEVSRWQSSFTMIAAGGAGQVYSNTTNPLIATGDGIAMAFRAGAAISHMEFVQFHPTALYDGSEGSMFLISEALRGDGAILKNEEGEDFIKEIDERGSLASRDIVARAIEMEMKKGRKPFVYLDCRHLTPDAVENHFPNIHQRCLQAGIDMQKQMIPVAPAAHYICGGIVTDEWGQTNITGLFAAGETASTGLHGANRLASNSLLEALVFAHRAYMTVIQKLDNHTVISPALPAEFQHPSKEVNNAHIAQQRKELQQLMFQYAGIIRNNDGLQKGLEQVLTLKKDIEKKYTLHRPGQDICEIRNLLDVAQLIINQSINRKENKGGFYNSDLAAGVISN